MAYGESNGHVIDASHDLERWRPWSWATCLTKLRVVNLCMCVHVCMFPAQYLENSWAYRFFYTMGQCIKWSLGRWHHVTDKRSRSCPLYSWSKTVWDRGSVAKEMAYVEWNGHVIEDVTWPRKVKVWHDCVGPTGYWMALDRLPVCMNVM